MNNTWDKARGITKKMLRQKRLLRKNLVIKKTFSLPSPKGCGLFVGFLGCSEKSNSCKATVCNLKVAIYFSDISKLNYNIANLSELSKLNFQGGQQFIPSLKVRVSEPL